MNIVNPCFLVSPKNIGTDAMRIFLQNITYKPVSVENIISILDDLAFYDIIAVRNSIIGEHFLNIFRNRLKQFPKAVIYVSLPGPKRLEILCTVNKLALGPYSNIFDKKTTYLMKILEPVMSNKFLKIKLSKRPPSIVTTRTEFSVLGTFSLLKCWEIIKKIENIEKDNCKAYLKFSSVLLENP